MDGGWDLPPQHFSGNFLKFTYTKLSLRGIVPSPTRFGSKQNIIYHFFVACQDFLDEKPSEIKLQ